MYKILVIKNSDQRLLYLSNYLKKLNHDIIYITDQETFCNELLKKDVDAVILPVRGVNDEGIVDGTNVKIQTEELTLLRDKIIVSGLLNTKFNQLCKQSDVKFMTYLNDDVAIKNNYITVEGVISHIVNKSNLAILDSNTLVVGYGKLGQITAKIFKELKSNVSIVARDHKDLTHAKISGVDAYSYNELIYIIDDYDFIINTVPSHVINEILLEKLSNKDIKIIDVASKPYGLDHNLAKLKHVDTIILPGIPGKTSPKTSGELIAKNTLYLLSGRLYDESQ